MSLRKSLCFLGIILFFNLCFSQSLDWVATGGGNGLERGYSTVRDVYGSIHTSGTFSQTANFAPNFTRTSNGGLDAFIASYSPNGSLIGAITFGGSGNDEVRNIAVDAQGNIYACGWFRNTVDFEPGPGTFPLTSNGSDDIFLAKFNQQGNLVWVNTFGGNGEDRAVTLKIHPSGLLIVSGRFSGTVDFDPGASTLIKNGVNSRNLFISAFDLNGNLFWNNTFIPSSSASYSANFLETTFKPNGNIVNVGAFYGTIDFDPSSNNHILSSNGNCDAVIVELTPGGSFVEAISWGASNFDAASSIHIDQFSNYCVGGSFYNTIDFDPGLGTTFKTSAGSRDMYISKLDSNGDLIWNRTNGGASAEVITNLNSDAQGNIYSVGYFYSNMDMDPDPNNIVMMNNNGGQDAFLWALDSAGNYLSSFAIGGSGNEIILGLDLGIDGEVFVGGKFSNTVDFDPDANNTVQHSSNGNSDFFTEKITICLPTIDSLNAYGCQFYISPSGKFFNSNGIYKDTISNQAGCDSILTIDLQLNQLNTTVIGNDPSLEANTNQNVSYQWLDCNNAYSPIQGETQATFTAVANGSYAVEISQGACKDTSTCYQIITIGVDESKLQENDIKLYPNPTDGIVYLQNDSKSKIQSFRILDIRGKAIQNRSIVKSSTSKLKLILPKDDGVYFVDIEFQNGKHITKKLVKL